jgi:hypothetical protein
VGEEMTGGGLSVREEKGKMPCHRPRKLCHVSKTTSKTTRGAELDCINYFRGLNIWFYISRGYVYQRPYIGG